MTHATSCDLLVRNGEIAAVWDVLERGYLQFLPIRHESLVANVQRLVEMAQELDSIREVEAGGGAE